MYRRGYERVSTEKSNYSFIFVAIAIIIVFVLLYYSYNFLFNKIGAPVPSVIIGNAISTISRPKIDTSFTPPYEGGDYTITFWMYVNANSLAGVGTNYRKHIVSIDGNSFSTVVIGLDAAVNNLIVRTHTGAADTSGISTRLTTSAGGTLSTTSTGTRGSCDFHYSAGGQTWFVPCAPGSCATSGAGACTPIGRIDRCSGKNKGWDADCNPCKVYWIAPDSSAGTGLGDIGWVGSNRAQATAVSYTDANPNPCNTNVCNFNTQTKSFTNAPTLVIGGEAARGTGGSSGNICTWSGQSQTDAFTDYVESFTSQEDFTTEEPEIVRENFASAGCESTSNLDSTTMKNLFDTPVAVPCSDSALPGCDSPEYDLQRWTHIAVVLSGKITDVYMNGKLARSCIGSSYYKVSVSPTINVLGYKTFNGKLSDLHTYVVALNPAQIYDMYTKGPTNK
jgi:hypothetical protein